MYSIAVATIHKLPYIWDNGQGRSVRHVYHPSSSDSLTLFQNIDTIHLFTISFQSFPWTSPFSLCTMAHRRKDWQKGDGPGAAGDGSNWKICTDRDFTFKRENGNWYCICHERQLVLYITLAQTAVIWFVLDLRSHQVGDMLVASQYSHVYCRIQREICAASRIVHVSWGLYERMGDWTFGG
jgi:hypothetical protein